MHSYRPPLHVLLIILLSLSGCAYDFRSKPWISYETSTGLLGAPFLSRLAGGDGVDTCAPGEVEADFGLMWRYQDLSFSYKYTTLTRCTPTEGRSYFSQSAVETVFSEGDDLDGCVLNFDFEGRLTGSWAFVAGLCDDGSQAAVGIERTGPGTWTPDLIIKTGQVVDTQTFAGAVGTDAHWDGVKTWFGLTYVDGLGAGRFALFERVGNAWSASDIFGPGDVPNVVDYFSPRVSGQSPDTFVTFQTSEVMFGPPASLYYSKIAPMMTAQKIVGLGEAVPTLAGETFSSFGLFQSTQAGDSRGAFTATTTPSNFNVALEYDITDSLSLTLRYKKDDRVPDTLEDAAQWTFPSYDGDRLGLRVQTNSSRFALVADTPNSLGGTTAGGFARTLVDRTLVRGIDNLSVTNNALVDGVAAYQAGLSTGDSVILAQDVERIEILRGGAATLYGSDAIAGVVNFVTGPDTGFDRIDKGSFDSDYGGATFFGNDFVVGNSLGFLLKWDSNLGHEVTLGDTGIGAPITGLTTSSLASMYASTATSFYHLDPQAGFSATLRGNFQTSLAAPITDVSDIFYADDTYFALRLGGEIGELDPFTAVYTPRIQVQGLTADARSGTIDGERVFLGLDDGLLIEVLDCLPAAAEAVANGLPVVQDLGYNVVGSSGPGGIPALASPVPEPGSAALGLAALWTLRRIARRLRRSEQARQ